MNAIPVNGRRMRIWAKGAAWCGMCPLDKDDPDVPEESRPQTPAPAAVTVGLLVLGSGALSRVLA